jgi:hypothetical protein
VTCVLLNVMESTPTTATGHGDEPLVDDLRDLLDAVDPLPEHAQFAARVAIEWRALDAELAALVHDSVVDEPALALRGEGGPRALSFEANGLTIELEAEYDADGDIRVCGQLIPPQPAQVSVHHGDGLVSARADDRGRFEAAGLAPGPLSLRCRLHDARRVETATLTI